MNMLLGIIAMFLLGFTDAIYDRTLKMFCERNGKGIFTPREDKSVIRFVFTNLGFISIRAARIYSEDECKLRVGEFAKDEKSALKYCEYWAPFTVARIEKNTEKNEMVCVLRTSLFCPSDMVQIWGKCYLLVHSSNRMTRKEAEKNCKSASGRIAKLDRPRLTRMWNAFYPTLSTVWVQASEDYNEYVVYESGDNYALVFGDAINYRSRPQALVKLGDDDVAMTICEVEGIDTGRTKSLSEKYSQIYYPVTLAGHASFVRTSNLYGRNFEDYFEQHHVCEKALKPYGPRFKRALLLEDDSLMSVSNKFDQNLVYARLPYVRNKTFSERARLHGCVSWGVNNDWIEEDYAMMYQKSSGGTYVSQTISQFKTNWKHETTYEVCDSQTSSAITKEKELIKLRTLSDASRAPIFCEFQVNMRQYAPCDSSYVPYTRESGQVFCHKLGTVFNQTYYNAQEACRDEGGHLTGFETADEMNFLIDLVQKSGNLKNYWIGARRSIECSWNGRRNGLGYDPDQNSICSRSRVFKWEHGVASDENTIKDEYWVKSPPQPDYTHSLESCLEIIFGPQKKWLNYQTVNGQLNDNECFVQQGYICGKAAVIIDV